MRQRLGLASALLGDPQILVLDEPLNGLDPQGIRWLRTLLRERAASGGTVLLSSHVLTEAAQTVDDVVVIHKGRLVRQGSIEDLEAPGAGGVFVSTPTRERLATAVRRAGGRVEFQNGAGGLLIEGLDAAEVGELAHGERVLVHQLATRAGSLEEMFFRLTEEDDDMTALIRGEWIKTMSTRTLLGYAATGLALAIANVLIVTQASGVLDQVPDKQEALAGLPILLLLFGLVGAAGEYRHRTAAPAALMARRAHGQLLLARAGAYAATGLAIAALMAAVSLALGLPLLTGEPGRALGSSDVAGVVGGSLLAAALSAIVGVALGALVRNQVAGVVGVLIMVLVVSELIAAIDETAVGYTPFGAAAKLAGDPGGGTLSWAAAALAMSGWAVALLIAAIVVEHRRDMA